VTGLVGLHASFTVSDEAVREAGVLAHKLAVPVHVHVAEDKADVEDAWRRGYGGPLERLLQLEALPPGSVLAHGVHLDEAAVKRADAAGLWLVQNPRSNEGNKVGYPHALAASTHVALGTDGWAADMEAERAALHRLGKAHGELEPALHEREEGGFALLNWLTKLHTGAIDSDATADVVVGVAGQRPRHVVVAGRPVVVDGELVTADLEEIRAHAKEEAVRLWARL
jgi:cytosine/adenosine deaminase-related metal-dependent hydrolase